MKDELEDLSFKQLNREAFVQIKNMVALKRAERRDFLGEIRKTIIVEAAAAGIVVTVESRAKHFYSIYQKMRKRSKAVEDIYDLLGIRILCETVDDCYNILGLTHRLWKPLEGRFKDYIAMHKANGYQSLHTTVMCVPDQDGEQPLEGRLLEIQIRTHEMHRTAEHGIASHWLYKRGGGAQAVKPGEIAIIDRLRDWKQAEEETKKQAGEQAREKAGDTARKKAGRKTRKQAGEEAGQEAEEGEDPPLTFLEEIKKELLRDSIYVFTPQGKVIELPAGATPIDFAYSIHSAVGNRCSGAKANGNIIPLNAALQNTQVVEILTATNARPHVNWLRFAKTSKARNRIRSWLQENDDSVIIEKNVIAKKKTPLPEPARDAPPPEKPPEAPIQHFVHEQIGTSGAFQVRVEDEKNMMIRFAKCCNPVSGDPIVGYVSRGRGIVIHRRNCRNLTNIPDFAERRIETEWETGGDLIKHFKIEARLSADLFSEIEGAARKQEGHLIEGRLEETSANHLTGFFTMQLQRPEDLKTIMKNIRGIPAVYSILSLN
jgi:GTP pyrophosphokinase